MKSVEKYKKTLLKMIYPPVFLVFILFNVSFAGLIYAFCYETCPEAAAYAFYAISAYTLVIVCVRIPGIIRKIKKMLYNNKLTNKYLTEKELRMRVSLYGGLLFNICFAVFKVVMGIIYQSEWLFAIAGYNTVLSIMRFMLVNADLHKIKTAEEELSRKKAVRSCILCGRLMLVLNIAVFVIVAMIVFDRHTITYPGFIIFAIAAYTFYCMTTAIINIIRYRHLENPVLYAVKRISMAKALVSIFTLQAAMLTQFGTADLIQTSLANAATGLSVCVIITVIAVLMLRKKELINGK